MKIVRVVLTENTRTPRDPYGVDRVGEEFCQPFYVVTGGRLTADHGDHIHVVQHG